MNAAYAAASRATTPALTNEEEESYDALKARAEYYASEASSFNGFALNFIGEDAAKDVEKKKSQS